VRDQLHFQLAESIDPHRLASNKNDGCNGNQDRKCKKWIHRRTLYAFAAF
jgi:hypothetical protein